MLFYSRRFSPHMNRLAKNIIPQFLQSNSRILKITAVALESTSSKKRKENQSFICLRRGGCCNANKYQAE